MPKVILVAGMSKAIPLVENAHYIGIDHGAVCCMHQQIPMIIAIGDFDSVCAEDYEQLKKYTKVNKLSANKNETDSEEAILYALQEGYDDIVLYGSLGGRIDHELANLYLLIHRDLPITLMDEQNSIQVLKPGSYKVKKQFKYLSFLALEDSCITQSGVVYPLELCKLTTKDIFPISNEICEDFARITLHYGRMLMMQTEDRAAGIQS